MPQQYSTLVLIALMVVAFYLLILRPQKKRQQALQKTMRALEPGTRVLLGSGLFGTIVTIGEKQATLEISPGTHLTVLKQAIVRVATSADEDGPDEDEIDDVLVEHEELTPADDALETSYAADPAVEPVRPLTSEPSTSENERNNLR